VWKPHHLEAVHLIFPNTAGGGKGARIRGKGGILGKKGETAPEYPHGEERKKPRNERGGVTPIFGKKGLNARRRSGVSATTTGL